MITNIELELYNNLTDAEQSVINYINQHEDSIPLMSITTIANNSCTSPATVTRAIQKCGFNGITQLRYQISQRNNVNSEQESPYIVNTILNKTFREATKTIDGIVISSILKIIDYINSAKRIFLYARGHTTTVAEDFQMHLQLLGYHTIVVTDVNWMRNTGKIIQKEDLLIIISVRNSSTELNSSARQAQRNGAKVVSFCCREGSDLEKNSDVYVLGHSEMIMDRYGLTDFSRIPLFIITRTVIEYLSQN